jgi:hypothetical protein
VIVNFLSEIFFSFLYSLIYLILVHKQLFGTKNWFQTSDLIGFAVKRGTSRGCLFHRVMKHYVIQAGDGGLLGDTEDWTLRGKHYSQLDTWLLA